MAMDLYQLMIWLPWMKDQQEEDSWLFLGKKFPGNDFVYLIEPCLFIWICHPPVPQTGLYARMSAFHYFIWESLFFATGLISTPPKTKYSSCETHTHTYTLWYVIRELINSWDWDKRNASLPSIIIKKIRNTWKTAVIEHWCAMWINCFSI